MFSKFKGKSLKTKKKRTVVEAHPCQPLCPSMADLTKAPEPERRFHLLCSPVCPPVRSTCMGNQPPAFTCSLPHAHGSVIFGKIVALLTAATPYLAKYVPLDMNMFCCHPGLSCFALATHRLCTLRVLTPHIASRCAPWAAHIAHLGWRTLPTLTAHISQSEVHMYVHMFVSDFWSFSDFCKILVYALLDYDNTFITWSYVHGFMN